jgi:hypothetical protein
MNSFFSKPLFLGIVVVVNCPRKKKLKTKTKTEKRMNR